MKEQAHFGVLRNKSVGHLIGKQGSLYFLAS